MRKGKRDGKEQEVEKRGKERQEGKEKEWKEKGKGEQ